MQPAMQPAMQLLHEPRADLERMPSGYFGGGRVLPALVPACCVDMGLLASFQDAMAAAGESVAVQRMRYDRRYAFQRIAHAHGLSDPLLRRIAVLLFEVYQA